MTIRIVRDRAHKMKHTVHVREHSLAIDEPPDNGGEDLGATPHDLYDSALGACKALTVLWYARRKQMPLDDIRVDVERDDSQERQGTYRLRVRLALTGALSDAQRQELLTVAGKFAQNHVRAIAPWRNPRHERSQRLHLVAQCDAASGVSGYHVGLQLIQPAVQIHVCIPAVPQGDNEPAMEVHYPIVAVQGLCEQPPPFFQEAREPRFSRSPATTTPLPA